jgi:hypothetical protein
VGRTSADLRALLALSLLFISGGCSGDNHKGAAGKYHQPALVLAQGGQVEAWDLPAAVRASSPGVRLAWPREKAKVKSKKVKLEDLSFPSATWER